MNWFLRLAPPAAILLIFFSASPLWRPFFLTLFYVAMALLWASIEWADGAGSKPRGFSRIYFAANIGLAAILAALPSSASLALK